MDFRIAKKGQGRYVRWTAYILGGLLVGFGAIRLYATINVPFDSDTASAIEKAFHWGSIPVLGEITLYKTIAIVVGLLGLLALHALLNRANTVDLLIDTEQELRKVSWPTRKEVQNATMVVVLVTVTMGLVMSGFDFLIEELFKLFYGS